MKVLLIGASGTIGNGVYQHLKDRHEIITAGRNSGDYRFDLKDRVSMKKMFADIGQVDAIICASGEARWKPLLELTEEDFYLGIHSKLMGQVMVVAEGHKIVSTGGSITLTTGILADNPVATSSAAAMVNGGIHSFVIGAARELAGKVRINVISPGLLEESAEKYADYFPGFVPVPMKTVAAAYQRSLEGIFTGDVVRVY
ncbi:short chain dehydrogenase [Chitinophagales bacterium]|nr:short chain dehydrogenase [Chitinophagales bacterium]